MLQQGKTPKQVCSRIGVALLAMMVVWQLLGGGLIGAIMLFAPQLAAIPWMALLLNDLTLYLLGFPVFLLIMRTVPNGANRAESPAPFGVPAFLAVLVVSFGAMYVGNYITLALYALSELISGGSALDVLGSLTVEVGALPNFLLLAVVPAVGEEFIFRYMIGRKMRGAGDGNYILLSSVCFAFFHANIQQMLYAFILGAIFAWVYARTRKIWLTMLLHLAINTMGIVGQPALVEAGLTVMALGFMFSSIAGAIVLLVLNLKKARAALQPPAEPGWPLDKAMRRAQAAYAPLPPLPARNTMPGGMGDLQPQYVDLPVAPPPAQAAQPLPDAAMAGMQPQPSAQPPQQTPPLQTGFAQARTSGQLDEAAQPYDPRAAMAPPYSAPRRNVWVPPEEQAARQAQAAQYAQYAQYAGYGPAPARSMLFGNFGMIFYLVVTGGLALLMFAVPLLLSSLNVDLSAFSNLGL